MQLVLLTSRYFGCEETHENINEGVFSSVEKAIEAVQSQHSNSKVEHFNDGNGCGRFEVSQSRLGSAFNYTYDYSTIELDKII